MQQLSIKTPYVGILSALEWETIRAALKPGASGLVSKHLAQYPMPGTVAEFVGEFMEDHKAELDARDFATLVEDPDFIIRQAAEEFRFALVRAFKHTSNPDEWAEEVLSRASAWLDDCGPARFFVFCDQWANAANSLFVIRAANESEAYEELLCRFAEHFKISEEDADEDTCRNDDGTPCNTEYLSLLCSLEFLKPDPPKKWAPLPEGFGCKSVAGGWQSMVSATGETFGPIFNSSAHLWQWQGKHLKASGPHFEPLE